MRWWCTGSPTRAASVATLRPLRRCTATGTRRRPHVCGHDAVRPVPTQRHVARNCNRKEKKHVKTNTKGILENIGKPGHVQKHFVVTPMRANGVFFYCASHNNLRCLHLVNAARMEIQVFFGCLLSRANGQKKAPVERQNAPLWGVLSFHRGFFFVPLFEIAKNYKKTKHPPPPPWVWGKY